MIGAIIGMHVAMTTAMLEAERKREIDAAFEQSIAGLPAEEAAAMRAERREEEERYRKEAIEERRHRELCYAIRRSGKWF